MTADSPAATEARIREARVIAILRIDRAEPIVGLCRVLAGLGLAVEITMDRPHAVASIASARDALGDQALLGAGTVLDEGAVDAAVSAGADFCVAPNLDPAVVAACARLDVLAIPGVFTPTEIARADRLGLRLLKLFPCGGLTPAFLKALRGPFSSVGFVPTGGIGVSDAKGWLDAGAAAVGLGSALVGPDDSQADLASRARRLADSLRDKGARRDI